MLNEPLRITGRKPRPHDAQAEADSWNAAAAMLGGGF